MNRRLRTVAFFSLLTSTAVARQACPGYWESMNTLPGTDGPISYSVNWDPDGTGPAPERLVIAGSFNAVGSTTVLNAAYLQGDAVVPLGTNLYSLNGLITFGSDLLALSFQNGRPVQRWNGLSWQGMGPAYQVNPLCAIVFQEELIIGGWKEILKWTGSGWATLGDGLNSYVYGLASFQGKLVAVGAFTMSGSTPVRFIAEWDGSRWTQLAGGAWSPVESVTTHGDQLISFGRFWNNDGSLIDGLASWNGQSWSLLPAPISPVSRVASIAGTLYGFDGTSGVQYLAGDHWERLGTLSKCSTLTLHRGRLVAGGGRSAQNNSVFEYDGTDWASVVRGGMNQPFGPIADTPEGLAVLNPNRNYDGQPSSGLMRYSDNQWSDFPNSQTDGTIVSIQSDGEALYAWGSFTEIGGVPVPQAARYANGVWEPTLVPLPDDVFNPQPDGSILFTRNFDAHEYRDGVSVALGNHFTAAYGPPTALLRWNNDILFATGPIPNEETGITQSCWRLVEDTWVPFGPGGVRVSGLCVVEGDLYAGIETPWPHRYFVGKWDGTDWIPVGADFNRWVGSLKVIRNQITAFGDFMQVGGQACPSPASWDGSSWSSLTGSYATGDARQAVEREDRVFFLTNACPTSYGIAAWVRPFGPTINLQPADVNVCLGGALDSTTDACGDGIEFRWFLNGTSLADGTLGTGAVVTGSGTASLHIDQITAAELGSLMCRVSNAHGTLDSDTVSISTCIADFDCTGFADTDDFDSFVLSFEAGDQRADVDGSGFVDTDDFDFFVHAFEAGCP